MARGQPHKASHQKLIACKQKAAAARRANLQISEGKSTIGQQQAEGQMKNKQQTAPHLSGSKTQAATNLLPQGQQQQAQPVRLQPQQQSKVCTNGHQATAMTFTFPSTIQYTASAAPLLQQTTTTPPTATTKAGNLSLRFKTEVLKKFFEEPTARKLHILTMADEGTAKPPTNTEILDLFSEVTPRESSIEKLLTHNLFAIVRGYSMEEKLTVNYKDQLIAIVVNMDSRNHCILASRYLEQLQKQHNITKLSLIKYQSKKSIVQEVTIESGKALTKAIDALDEHGICYGASELVRQHFRGKISSLKLKTRSKANTLPQASLYTTSAVVATGSLSPAIPASLPATMPQSFKPIESKQAIEERLESPQEITYEEIAKAKKMSIDQIKRLDIDALMRVGLALNKHNPKCSRALYCTLRAATWKIKEEGDKDCRTQARCNLNIFLNEHHSSNPYARFLKPAYAEADKILDEWFQDFLPNIAWIIVNKHKDSLECDRHLLAIFQKEAGKMSLPIVTRQASAPALSHTKRASNSSVSKAATSSQRRSTAEKQQPKNISAAKISVIVKTKKDQVVGKTRKATEQNELHASKVKKRRFQEYTKGQTVTKAVQAVGKTRKAAEQDDLRAPVVKKQRKQLIGVGHSQTETPMEDLTTTVSRQPTAKLQPRSVSLSPISYYENSSDDEIPLSEVKRRRRCLIRRKSPELAISTNGACATAMRNTSIFTFATAAATEIKQAPDLSASNDDKTVASAMPSEIAKSQVLSIMYQAACKAVLNTQDVAQEYNHLIEKLKSVYPDKTGNRELSDFLQTLKVWSYYTTEKLGYLDELELAGNIGFERHPLVLFFYKITKRTHRTLEMNHRHRGASIDCLVSNPYAYLPAIIDSWLIQDTIKLDNFIKENTSMKSVNEYMQYFSSYDYDSDNGDPQSTVEKYLALKYVCEKLPENTTEHTYFHEYLSLFEQVLHKEELYLYSLQQHTQESPNSYTPQ